MATKCQLNFIQVSGDFDLDVPSSVKKERQPNMMETDSIHPNDVY